MDSRLDIDRCLPEDTNRFYPRIVKLSLLSVNSNILRIGPPHSDLPADKLYLPIVNRPLYGEIVSRLNIDKCRF